MQSEKIRSKNPQKTARVSWLAKVQVCCVLCCMVPIVRRTMRCWEGKFSWVATESRRSLQITTCSPLSTCRKRGCDLRLNQRLSLQQSVRSHIARAVFFWGGVTREGVEISNCSTAGAAIAVLPCLGRWMRGGAWEPVRTEAEDADSCTSSRPSPSSTCNSPTGVP